MDTPPRDYGFWQAREGPLDASATKALILGGSKVGWIVCAVDEATWRRIADITQMFSEGVGAAIPCGTFSPSRERPPGPRPLRSVDLELRAHGSLRTSGTYRAHENTVQKWVEGPDGRQRTSKAQGEHAEELWRSAEIQEPL